MSTGDDPARNYAQNYAQNYARNYAQNYAQNYVRKTTRIPDCYSECDQKLESECVMDQPDLRAAMSYCKFGRLFYGLYGNLIEKYISIKFNMIKVPEKKRCGDLYSEKFKVHYEIKASLGGANNTFHFYHLRIEHNCDYLICAYVSYGNTVEGDALFVFNVPRLQMQKICVKYGRLMFGYDNFYELHVSYQNPCWNELIKWQTTRFD